MSKHIQYCFMTVKLPGHPQKVMKELGITYQHAVPQSLHDSWEFWNCENLPDTLPEGMTITNWDPMKRIGNGLNKETAEMIRDYGDVKVIHGKTTFEQQQEVAREVIKQNEAIRDSLHELIDIKGMEIAFEAARDALEAYKARENAREIIELIEILSSMSYRCRGRKVDG